MLKKTCKTRLKYSFLFKKNIYKVFYSWKPGEFLGEGSFATVVMGFNEETGQIMAVKQIRLTEAAKSKNVNTDLYDVYT